MDICSMCKWECIRRIARCDRIRNCTLKLSSLHKQTYFTKSNTVTLLPTGEIKQFPSGVNRRFPLRYTVPRRFENCFFVSLLEPQSQLANPSVRFELVLTLKSVFMVNSQKSAPQRLLYCFRSKKVGLSIRARISCFFRPRELSLESTSVVASGMWFPETRDFGGARKCGFRGSRSQTRLNQARQTRQDSGSGCCLLVFHSAPNNRAAALNSLSS